MTLKPIQQVIKHLKQHMTLSQWDYSAFYSWNKDKRLGPHYTTDVREMRSSFFPEGLRPDSKQHKRSIDYI